MTQKSPAADSRFLISSILLALGILTLLGLTLRQGHNWDGDYALNVMQAMNLVDGRAYTSTYFVPNPENAIHPALYPPGLPLLLSIVYRMEGLDLEAMKWVGLVTLSLWAIVFARVGRRFLPAWMALGVTALFAVHPYIWDLKDTIYAEFPFLFFCYLTLLFAQRSVDEDASAGPRFAFAVAMALALAAAYLTRTVAIVLFPVVVVYSIYRCRRVTRTLGALAVALGIILTVQHWLPADAGTYISYFSNFSVRGMITAVQDYGVAVGTLLQLQQRGLTALDWIFVPVFLALVATGFIARLRAGPSIFEVFLAAYVALLFVFPIHWEFDRYSMPVWPLLLVYAFAGTQIVSRLQSPVPWRFVLPATLFAGLAVSFGVVYTQTSLAPIADSVTDPRSSAMFQAIRTEVPVNAVVLARKPTIIGLIARRHASIWPHTFSDNEFWAYVRHIHASYLVQDVYQFSAGPFKPNDPLDVFVRSHQDALRLVFHNEWFNVYQLHPPADVHLRQAHNHPEADPPLTLATQ